MAVTSRSSRNAAFDLWRNEKALSAFANAMAAPAPSRFRAECQMEKVLLELKLTRARSETVMRWIAMGIAVLPEHLRDEEYGEVMGAVIEMVRRNGLSGGEAQECQARFMDTIRALVRALDAKCGARAHRRVA